MNAAKKNKYAYLHVLQADYGHGDGWEDLTASEDPREVRRDCRAYRENEPGIPRRTIKRRELNEAAQ